MATETGSFHNKSSYTGHLFFFKPDTLFIFFFPFPFSFLILFLFFFFLLLFLFFSSLPLSVSTSLSHSLFFSLQFFFQLLS